MGRHAAALAASFVLLLAVPAGDGDDAEKLELSDLTFERDDAGVYVTLQVRGAFPPKVRAAMQSGVPLSFQYTLKLRRRRAILPDRTVVRKGIETRVKLDVLSREYLLSRSMDGHVLTARSTRDLAVAMEWMTRLDRVKIAEAETLAPDATYDLMAKVKVLDEFVLFVIPWAIETPWQRQSLIPAPRNP